MPEPVGVLVLREVRGAEQLVDHREAEVLVVGFDVSRVV